MASEIRVNTINSRTGLGTITVSETGQDLAGISTIANLYVPEYITHKGDTNTKFGFNNADTISAHTNGSERLRIDSSGNVGINEDSSLMDNGLLTLKFGTDKHMGISASQSELGSMPGLVAFKDNGTVQDIGLRGNIIRLATGSAERFRIDASGRLLGGLTSSVRSTAYLQLKGANTSDIALYWPQDAATAGSAISWLTDGGAAATETARIFCGQTTTGADGGYIALMTHNGSSTTEKMRIASDGKVGIGLNNPGSMLHVQNSGQTDIVLGSTNAGGVYLILDGDSNGDGAGADYSYVAHDTGGDLLIGADNPSGNAEIIIKAGNNSEALRIDSSRRLLQGLTSARGNFGNNTSGVEVSKQMEGTSYVTSCMSIVRNSNDANDGGIILGKTRATSVGGNTVVQSGDYLGELMWAGSDGTSLLEGARIDAIVESGVGNDDMPTALRFLTNGGSTAPTERMRINAAGQVKIGSGSATGIHNLAKVLEIAGGDGGDLIIGNDASSNIGAGAHIGAIAFKNIDSSTGSTPHYAGIRCESLDTAGNMDLRFYTGTNKLETDDPQVYMVGSSLNIGSTSVTSYPLYVKTTTTVGVAKFESTVGTNEATEVAIVKNSSSPADGDQVGYLQMMGNNDNSEMLIYNAIISQAQDVSDGAEDGDFYFFCRNNGAFQEVLRMKHDGTFYGSSSNDISDQRLKENITTVTNPTDKIKALTGRTFNWKSEANFRTGTQYGFIAQEVESVVSDLVDSTSGIRQFDKDGNLIQQDEKALENRDEGTTYAKSVNAIGVVPILVEALKEALTEIDNLKARVTTLESA